MVTPAIPPNHPPVRRPKSERQRGGQPGHAGTTRELVSLEQVKTSYDLKPPVCHQCGEPLTGEDIEPYRHQVTDIRPVVAEVTEYRLHTLVCGGCGAETTAELPAGVSPSVFGLRLQAMISLLSGRYHLSKRDGAEVMTDFFQAEVSLGFVPTLEQRTSAALKEPVSLFKKRCSLFKAKWEICCASASPAPTPKPLPPVGTSSNEKPPCGPSSMLKGSSRPIIWPSA